MIIFLKLAISYLGSINHDENETTELIPNEYVKSKNKDAEIVLKEFTSKGYIRKKVFDNNLTLITNGNERYKLKKLRKIISLKVMHVINVVISRFIKRRNSLNVLLVIIK